MPTSSALSPPQTLSPPQRFCTVSCRERRRGLRAYEEGQD